MLWPGVARAAKVVRRLRFFGHNAPASYQFYDTNPAVPPQNRWKTATINGAFDAFTSVYPLDARYEDLKPGARLLVDAGAGSTPRLRTRRRRGGGRGAGEPRQRLAIPSPGYGCGRRCVAAPAVLVRADGGLLFAARSGAGSVLVLESRPSAELEGPHRSGRVGRSGGRFRRCRRAWTSSCATRSATCNGRRGRRTPGGPGPILAAS